MGSSVGTLGAVVLLAGGAALAACSPPLRFDNTVPPLGAEPSGSLPITTGGERGAPTPRPSASARVLPQALTRAGTPLQVGASAPPIRVQSATQALDSRRALEGGPVVLVFFIGEFCAYCRRQLAAFEQRAPAFREAGVSLWGISSDTMPALNDMRRELALSFPLASDASLSAIGSFGIESRGTGTALPAVYVLAPDGAGGRVVFAQVGGTLEDRASIDEVLAAARAARSSR